MLKLTQMTALILFSLCHSTIYGQCSCAHTASLNWSQLSWNDGDFTNDYDIVTSGALTVNVGFNIRTNASGSFNDYDVTTPYKDGPGASGHFFNVGLDLGVIFNPSSNQGQSPVFIDVTFDQPVTCLVFDISDIDISGSNRRDRVIVTGNNGSVVPSLSVVSSDPTVSVSNNVASAIGGNSGANNDGAADEGTDNGNVVVDFGSESITSIRVNYREISGVSNPAGRGIGLFGNFSFCAPSLLPLKLLSFESSDHNEDCMAELSWHTADETNLHYYQVDFSAEGESFSTIGTIVPQSGHTQKEYYFETTKPMEGYYQLSEVTLDGRRNILAIDHFTPGCVSSDPSMIFPNPTVNQNVTWQLPSLANGHLSKLDIFDHYGKRLTDQLEYVTDGKMITINIPGLPKGIYLMQAEINGHRYHESIMIL